jgi:hypothetical protein
MSFAAAFRQSVVQLKEAEDLLERGGPTIENLFHVYIITTIWARYWKDHWPTEKGRKIWKESLAATKPDEERFIAAVQRWGKKYNIEIVRLQ